MAQAKALDALEPFVILAKSATSPRAAADLVDRAISHPGTFIFAELLQTPEVQALASADAQYAVYLTLLQIFSYGTYTDYERGSFAQPPMTSHPSTAGQNNIIPTTTNPTTPTAAQEEATATATARATAPNSAPTETADRSSPSLPSLNPAQDRKLRQLSLISAATRRDSLTYSHLLHELRLHDTAELENTVVSAIYAGLIAATLDPAHEVVRISAVAPLRDLAPTAVPHLRSSLQEWTDHCENSLADMEAQIAAVRSAASTKAAADRHWKTTFKTALEDEKQRGLRRGGGGGDDSLRDPFGFGRSGADPLSVSRTLHGLNASASVKSFANGLQQRLMKRGSSGAAGGLVADDGAMDVDEEGGSLIDAHKRANRRK